MALASIAFSRREQFSWCRHCLCILFLMLAIPAHSVPLQTSSITVSKRGSELRLSTPGLQRTPRIAKSGEPLAAFAPEVTHPKERVARLTLRTRRAAKGPLQGVSVTLIYEVYGGFPVIGKWIEFRNGSENRQLARFDKPAPAPQNKHFGQYRLEMENLHEQPNQPAGCVERPKERQGP